MIRRYTMRAASALALVATATVGLAQSTAAATALLEERTSAATFEAASTIWLTGDPDYARVLEDTFYREDFSAATLADAGWTVERVEPADVDLWEISRGATVTGAFTNVEAGSPDFDETTANGYALVNYDQYNTGGQGFNPDIGRMNQSIVSPSFSTVGATELLTVSMYTAFRYCCNGNDNAVFLSYSLDGGTTFSVDEPVFPEAILTEVNVATRQYRQVNLPEEVLNQPDVRLRITHAGYFYYFILDDLYVTTRPDVELQLNPNWVAIAPNFQTPVSQADSVVFMVDLQNNGKRAQEVRVINEIYSLDGNNRLDELLYTDTLEYGMVGVDSLAENLINPKRAAMPTSVGRYAMWYEVTSPDIEDDPVVRYNTLGRIFEITEDTWSKGPADRIVVPTAANNGPYAHGSLYYFGADADPENVTIESVTIGVEVLNIGANDDKPFLEVAVYGWYGDLNGNGDADVPDGEEVVELALTDIELSATAPDGDFITILPVENMATAAVDDQYAAILVEARYQPANGGNASDDEVSLLFSDPLYGPTNFATSSDGKAPRLVGFLDTGDGMNDLGFYSNVSPYSEVVISALTSTEEQPLPADAFTVSPNPADDQLLVDFDLGAPGRAWVKLVDGQGRTLRSYRADDSGVGRVTMPIALLPAGTYAVKVVTASGLARSKRVLVQR